MIKCPYCSEAFSPYSNRTSCPHCAQMLFGVTCPSCGRKTLNLTQISRYGKATCFSCNAQFEQVPDAQPAVEQPALVAAPAPAGPPGSTPPAAIPSVTPRAPKHPVMPSAEESRAVLEQCLIGLDRAAQDRDMLCAPDLRAIVTHFLDTVQAALELDAAMKRQEVTEEWLRERSNLDKVARLCYTSLWPDEAALLPSAVQVWALAVDDAARRWQYARRAWLADTFGLTMMPTVPGITTTNPTWQDITGAGQIVSRVFSPGFLLKGEVLRKALVRA